MSIEAVSDFQMLSSERFEDAPPKLVLLHSETNRVIEVVGAVLEAQFKNGDDYLLFITEDSPFEEALHILLLTPDLRTKDATLVAAPYTQGILRDVAVVAPNKIEFSFFDPRKKWVLEVLVKARIVLWGNRFPVKRQAPLFHRTWLVLRSDSD